MWCGIGVVAMAMAVQLEVGSDGGSGSGSGSVYRAAAIQAIQLALSGALMVMWDERPEGKVKLKLKSLMRGAGLHERKAEMFWRPGTV